MFSQVLQDEEFACHYGVIEEIDEATYTAKVILYPYGILTGFLPISTPAIGVFAMPSKGTLVKVDLIQNNINVGVISAMLYEKKQNIVSKVKNNKQSSKAKEGWYIFKHYESGAEFHFTKEGLYEFYTPDGISIKADKTITIDSNVEVNVKAPSVKLSNGTLSKLVRENFLTLYNNHITSYNTHTHLGNLGAPTTPPIIPETNVATSINATTQTQAG